MQQDTKPMVQLVVYICEHKSEKYTFAVAKPISRRNIDGFIEDSGWSVIVHILSRMPTLERGTLEAWTGDEAGLGAVCEWQRRDNLNIWLYSKEINQCSIMW